MPEGGSFGAHCSSWLHSPPPTRFRTLLLLILAPLAHPALLATPLHCRLSTLVPWRGAAAGSVRRLPCPRSLRTRTHADVPLTSQGVVRRARRSLRACAEPTESTEPQPDPDLVSAWLGAGTHAPTPSRPPSSALRSTRRVRPAPHAHPSRPRPRVDDEKASVLTDGSVPEVEPSEAERLLSSDEAVLVDLRTPWQFAREFVPGAINVPAGEPGPMGLTFHFREVRRRPRRRATPVAVLRAPPPEGRA